MRALTPALLASAASYWAPGRAIVITRVDGTVLRLAEMMSTRTFGGNTFLPGSCLVVGSIPLALNEEAASVDFDVFSDEGGAIDPNDVMDGLYRGAAVEIYAINRFTPADGLGLLFSGKAGAVQRKSHGRVTMQVIGPLGQAALALGHKFSPTCRWIFGDADCGKPLEPYKVIGTVTATGSGHSLPITGFNHADPMYDPRGGFFTVQSGRMTGFRFEFARPGFSAFLYLPVGELFSAGDILWIYPDCTYEPNDAGCVFHANILNFGGEPYMFGAQSLTGGINSLGATGTPSPGVPSKGDFGDFGAASDEPPKRPLSFHRNIIASEYVVPAMHDANGHAAVETDLKEFHFSLMKIGGWLEGDPNPPSFDYAAVAYASDGTFLGKSSPATLPATELDGEIEEYTAAFNGTVRVAIGSTIKVGLQGTYYLASEPANPDRWEANIYDIMVEDLRGTSHITASLEDGFDISNPPSVLPEHYFTDGQTSRIIGWIRSTPVVV